MKFALAEEVMGDLLKRLTICGMSIALLVSISCSNNPMESSLTDVEQGLALLGKGARSEIYSNMEGKFQFRFNVPSAWKKTSHGARNIKGTTDRSDVYIYSPSENRIPRFTVIVFYHDPGYPEDSAEFWSLWRENRIKEYLPERFLGRVDRGYGNIAGINVPMVVYDMLDEEQKISYRSTEYTMIVGGKLCTIQFTKPLPGSGDNSMGKEAVSQIDDILAGVAGSFEIKNL